MRLAGERTVRVRAQKLIEARLRLRQKVRRLRQMILSDVILQRQFAERQQRHVRRRRSGKLGQKFPERILGVGKPASATASSVIFKIACRCRSTGAFIVRIS